MYILRLCNEWRMKIYLTLQKEEVCAHCNVLAKYLLQNLLYFCTDKNTLVVFCHLSFRATFLSPYECSSLRRDRSQGKK